MLPILRRLGPLFLILYTFLPFLAAAFRISINMSFTYVISAVAYLSIIAVLLVNTAKVNFPKYLVYFSLFTLYTVVSDIFIVGIKPDIKYIYSNGMIVSFIVVFLIENGNYTDKLMRNILKINILILLIAVLVIIIQQIVNNRFLVDAQFEKAYFYDNNDTQIRLPSIYSYISGSITTGLSFLPILGYVLVDMMKKKNPHYVTFYILGAIFSFLTKYRWIMLNFITLLFLIPLYVKINFARLAAIVLAVVLFSFGGYLVLQKLEVPVDKYIQDRILESNSGGISNSTAGTRLLAVEVFSKLFSKNPIFGKGERLWSYGTQGDVELQWELRGRSSQIHVGYLSLLYTYGLVGGLFYILFLIFILRKLYLDAKIHNNWAAFFAFLGFVLANATLVEFNIADMGLVFVLAFNKYLLDKEAEKAPTIELTKAF